MKYKAVIFDLDGTILDTPEDLADSVNYALAENGLPQRTIDEVKRFVGNGIRKLIERSVPSGSDISVTDKVHETFTAYYKIHCADKTKPYDGIINMLVKLRENKVKIGVLSNKADYAVQDLCKKYFDGLIDVSAGEKTGIPKKPAPDGVYTVLEKMGVSTEACVYVGDSEVDVETAINSNMDCIGVDWGFRDRNVLENSGADVIVSTPEELFKAIC